METIDNEQLKLVLSIPSTPICVKLFEFESLSENNLYSHGVNIKFCQHLFRTLNNVLVHEKRKILLILPFYMHSIRNRKQKVSKDITINYSIYFPNSYFELK